jgi:RNA polymerase sigma-70 factor (ECF subfamily)
LPDSRDNDQWLSDLNSGGPAQEAAIADLRAILLSGLQRGLTKWLDPYSPELENLAEDAVQEGLVRIIDRLDTFEGRSKFTTWAYKVAIHIALSKLRRKEWENVSLDEMMDPKPDRAQGLSVMSSDIGPEMAYEQKETLERMGRILREELTERQMSLMQAVVLKGIPMEAIAQKMGVKRNALYKMMHDARKKLKSRLLVEGIDLEGVLSSYDKGKTAEGFVVQSKDG